MHMYKYIHVYKYVYIYIYMSIYIYYSAPCQPLSPLDRESSLLTTYWSESA